jgi:hypothetical protein
MIEFYGHALVLACETGEDESQFPEWSVVEM